MAIDGTDLRETRRELETALTDALARGEADPASLKLSARLGAITAEIGNRYEARRHFQFVAKSGPAVLGGDHPLVRQAETFLGSHAPAPAQRMAAAERAPAIRPAGREVERRPSRGLVPTSGDDRPAARRTRKKSLIWVVATSAAIAGVVAASAALWPRDGAAPTPPKSSSKPVPAPTHVAVTMTNGVVTVKWQDPTNGTVPFIVSGGTAGATADIRQQVDAGQTAVAVSGLNNSRDYCFTVVAVYSADQVAVSDLACTKH